MRWPGIEAIYGPTLRTTAVFGPGGEGEGDKRWEDLHTRVIEHVSRPILALPHLAHASDTRGCRTFASYLNITLASP